MLSTNPPTVSEETAAAPTLSHTKPRSNPQHGDCNELRCWSFIPPELCGTAERRRNGYNAAGRVYRQGRKEMKGGGESVFWPRPYTGEEMQQHLLAHTDSSDAAIINGAVSSPGQLCQLF